MQTIHSYCTTSRVEASEREEDKVQIALPSGSRSFLVLLCLLLSRNGLMATATTLAEDPLAAGRYSPSLKNAPLAYPPAPAPIIFASEEARQQQQEEDAVELPPVDTGWAAWSFVAAGFMLDMLVSILLLAQSPRSSSRSLTGLGNNF